MLITPEEVSKIIGAPMSNVNKYYPMLIDYLVTKYPKKNKVSFQVALLATIGVESGKFQPVREGYWLSDSWAKPYYNAQYSNRKDLGNRGGNDGWIYRGGGIFQITGLHNYQVYGKLIGVDLANHPEKILEPYASTATAIEYAVQHGLDIWAQRAYNTADDNLYPEEMCWRRIRKLVNGGYKHYDKFRGYVELFKKAGAKEGTNV